MGDIHLFILYLLPPRSTFLGTKANVVIANSDAIKRVAVKDFSKFVNRQAIRGTDRIPLPVFRAILANGFRLEADRAPVSQYVSP